MRRSFVSLLSLGLLRNRRTAAKRMRHTATQALEDRCLMDGVVASVSDITVTEGNSTTNAVLTIMLAHAEAAPVLVNYMTQAITATAGADYEAVEGTLTFAPGITSMPVSVPIYADVLSEADERFQFHINCAEMCEAHAHVHVLDNDPLPTVSVNDAAAVKEGQAGTTSARFTLTTRPSPARRRPARTFKRPISTPCSSWTTTATSRDRVCPRSREVIVMPTRARPTPH